MSFLAGQLLDKAATQEAELRKAKQELTRKQEAERRMANEMYVSVWTSTYAIEPTCDSHAGASRSPRRPKRKKNLEASKRRWKRKRGNSRSS